MGFLGEVGGYKVWGLYPQPQRPALRVHPQVSRQVCEEMDGDVVLLTYVGA